MSSASGKSPGWAAFDLKQRQKQGLEPELDKEPYPPIPSSFTSLRPCRNSASNGCSGRSFSSLLVPSVNFPTLEENKDCKKPMQGGNSGNKQQTKVAEVSNLVIAFNKLKELYSWADNSLIEDIMAAVDNDIDKASTLLGAMVSTGSFEENKETSIVELNSTSGNPYENCKLQADNGVFLGNDMTLILGRMKSIPIEPEWEEDDVYLSHRKDAIRFMSMASGMCFLFPTIKVERLLYSELFSIRVINFADKDIEISDTGRPAEEGNWIREEIDIIFLKTFSQ
ncbi:hypothetical protein CK203_089030 [Vitis vinifera]|uniref:Uncharacterized protein n=1 Tax=Vitis vinifera TaxID=29760 RepID=A0A438F5R5_VITVI|nr:hypothetical protein CK203_089030 [Vitis vinifera]